MTTHATTPTDGTLTIVEDPKQTKFSADRSQGTIVVESSESNFPKAIDELSSVRARNLALQYAATQGVSGPCINGSVGSAYPVNANGLTQEQVKEASADPLPPQHPDLQPFRYRVDVPVCRHFR